ncbi:MAG: DNA primase, partial [Acutalibacteraceae bacterium]
VCTELGCAVIYCHHHSKGVQGGKKSMDRASGSGVFARDPDALLDLIELDITDNLRKSETDKAICRLCEKALINVGYSIDEIASLDDLCSASTMTRLAREKLEFIAYNDYKKLLSDIEVAKKAVQSRTAWRIEGTLREFPKFEPINLWFDYPTHRIDDVGVLKDIQPESDSTWKQNFAKRKTNEQRSSERKEIIMTAFNACNMDGKVTVNDLAEYLGTTEKTVRNRLKEHGGFWIDNGEVGLKN